MHVIPAAADVAASADQAKQLQLFSAHVTVIYVYWVN